ncbi:hypothetical protein [Kutzneria sp. NPDC052558]|uniref:hypothetical protein n=1 Tax=Kutzneria sp. NPDC052558 TaxID=3364121 RepID=UPI0037CBB39B
MLGDRVGEVLRRHALLMVKPDEPVAWIEVAEAVRESGATVDHWDLATVGASLIVCDEPGETKLIANPDPDSWA